MVISGVDINAKGYNESTPLILAANGGHVGVIELLLKNPKISVHEQVLLLIFPVITNVGLYVTLL